MRKSLITTLFVGVFFFAGFGVISARTVAKSPSPYATAASSLRGDLTATQSATLSATLTATTDGTLASPSAAVVQKIQEKTDKDITDTSGKTKDKLVEILDQNPIASISWYNFVQHGIRRAITNGVPANILVLILLFPLITAIISFSRHVVGLKGFGVYTPAVLAVAFVSTGIMNGILLFLVILAAAMIMKQILKRMHLQYLPRTAMLLWGISIIMLGVLIGTSFIPANTFLTISIFPILIIMLLTENFMESQLSGSQSEATQLTVETVLIAIFCSVLISLPFVQSFALLQPELLLIAVAIINIIVGRYSGLRLLEWIRFRSVIDQ